MQHYAYWLALVLLVACDRPTDRPAQVASMASSNVEDEGAFQGDPYPWGRWRQAEPEALNAYYVGIAHILVRHRESQPAASTSQFVWREAPPASRRTREDAQLLAHEIGQEVRRSPEQFEALAKRHSEDPITQPFGGSFGVMRATNVPYELLDAHETLAENQTSRAFETPAGFHIVKRLPIPRESFAWYRRIAIAYAPATLWVRGGRKVTRSREEARGLARKLHEQLHNAPERFVEFIDAYSDEIAAEVGGEAGPQSNLEGALNVATRLTVPRLSPMQVSDVLDEYGAFTILQRLPDRTHQPRAFDALVVAFAGSQLETGAQRTEAEAHALALQLTKSIARHPKEFTAAKAQYCAETRCPAPAVVASDGSTFPTIYRALDKLAVDQVSSWIERGPRGFIVFVRRALPEGAASKTQRYFDLGPMLGAL